MIRLTAGCKVNLGLRILARRADGYHELDSLFYPLASPCDHLDIRHTKEPGFRVHCDMPGLDLTHNTLTRAYTLFCKAMHERGPDDEPDGGHDDWHGKGPDDGRGSRSNIGPDDKSILGQPNKQKPNLPPDLQSNLPPNLPPNLSPDLPPDLPLGLPPGMVITLHKGIPSGAGLGGGSSDAAALLLYLNSLVERPLRPTALAQTALKVGADCVFFLQKFPCRVTGIGERLSPVSLESHNFSQYILLLVCPNLHISTPWAFAQWDIFNSAAPGFSQNNLTKTGGGANGTPLSQTWSARHIRNDLEEPVFSQHPQLAALKADILQLHAEGAAMSGSGSSIFGLFSRANAHKAEVAAKALESADQRVFIAPL